MSSWFILNKYAEGPQWKSRILSANLFFHLRSHRNAKKISKDLFEPLCCYPIFSHTKNSILQGRSPVSCKDKAEEVAVGSNYIQCILLSKRESRNGRISARGLDSAPGPYNKVKRLRADNLLVQPRASLVNNEFITDTTVNV